MRGRFNTCFKLRLCLKAFVALIGIGVSLPACAQQDTGALQRYKPRLETNLRAGTERTILMTEAWVPLAQDSGRVIYGDARLMGDDGDNREWNFGIGYREMNASADAIYGVHGWFDRRRSSRGSVFHQFTGGVEYYTEGLDIRLNAYVPIRSWNAIPLRAHPRRPIWKIPVFITISRAVWWKNRCTARI